MGHCCNDCAEAESGGASNDVVDVAVEGLDVPVVRAVFNILDELNLVEHVLV